MDDYRPSLTLHPDEATEKQDIVNEPDKTAGEAVQMIEMLERLSPEEKQTVTQFASSIDVRDSGMVMQYGSAAQKKIASFSGTALEKVKAKDLGEVGGMLTDLITQLRGFNAEDEEKKGLRGLFRRSSGQLNALKTKYDSCEVNVNKIVDALEDHQVVLLKDVSQLDKMYDLNLAYFKELTMYILAGKQQLERVRGTDLVALQQKAQRTGLPEDAQAAHDLADACGRFEKKIYDLELTRNISIQMAPQIRLLQNNDSLMAEKIQSTIVNTIPLWKSQMLLTLGMAHSRQAMEAQRAVTDMTNELLKRNAEMLKQGTIDTAREAERGIVDIETLTQTNQSLIATLDEVVRIQNEGREKRQNAETELARIEGELKDKLLELRG